MIDNSKIGCIYLSEVAPFVYMIHTFYILPEQRGNGYGTKLLKYALLLAQKIGAKKILIQPGPFEFDGESISSEEYVKRLQKLISLYQKIGFKFAHPYLMTSVRFLYKMFGIIEDSNYLHVMTIENK